MDLNGNRALKAMKILMGSDLIARGLNIMNRQIRRKEAKRKDLFQEVTGRNIGLL